MEEIKSIIKDTIQNELDQLWIYALLSAVVAVISAFLVAYFKKRGENYATKKDIEQITEAIENVKKEHAKQMEVFKGGQAIKNERLKLLYESTVELKGVFFRCFIDSNHQHEFIEKCVDLMIHIQKESIFSTYLNSEYIIIETEYNNWIQIIEKAKATGQKTYTIELNSAKNAISEIQNKILGYQE